MAAHDNRQSSLSLALAMVCASPTPLLLLDGDSNIVACSVSFCEAFEMDPGACAGRRLFDLDAGKWGPPQLRSLLDATISGDAQIRDYEMELPVGEREPRAIVLSVRKLVYDDEVDNVRLLVAILDVTDARAAEKAGRMLAHHNAVLSQEIRHRVANSLQIIASVMMLKARKASSEEVRGHLRDARNRVLSIADLQRQLAVGGSEAVNLRTYLRKLCETIAASMIADPKALVLSVTASDTPVGADVAVSLGLIVTELVINSLKHGFPDDAHGAIEVGYEDAGANWSLSVADNGVGMTPVRSQTVSGLGTSIVQALARQLGAQVVVEPANPGTRVSVVHAAVRPADMAIDTAR